MNSVVNVVVIVMFRRLSGIPPLSLDLGADRRLRSVSSTCKSNDPIVLLLENAEKNEQKII